jgi:hypothetical protein
MSTTWMNHIWKEATDVKGTAKVILLNLAWHADEEGVAWPSLPTLAAEAGVAERTAQDALAELDALGWIRREFRPRRSTRYHLMDAEHRTRHTASDAVDRTLMGAESRTNGRGTPRARARSTAPRKTIDTTLKDTVVESRTEPQSVTIPTIARGNLREFFTDAQIDNGWTDTYRLMAEASVEVLPVESLVAYLNWCRRNKHTPTTDRAWTWFVKDQHDARETHMAAEADRQRAKQPAERPWWE